MPRIARTDEVENLIFVITAGHLSINENSNQQLLKVA